MPPSETPERFWEGDVNEAVVEEWKEDTTAFDRVRQVIDTTTDPQPASEIADRARVSEPTARKYLTTMTETGRVKSVSTDTGTEYMRSPQTIAMKRIAAIHREHTKDEVRAAIQRLREQLSDLQEKHEVPSVDELTLELDADDEGWQDVDRWQQIEENLEIAEAALSLYDFDPDDSNAAAARVSDADDGKTRERGSFADGDVESVA